ncbi:unnamed protein product [Orchesella dallaii]|uniref:CARD domain-containing protein n=1 Tax=Orchesella dallaii TaxID=48710 RepID=A0ABP1QYE6_9HEXA
MEKHQIDHINKNLNGLIKGTFCNPLLLSKLFSKGILSIEEMEELEIKANTRGHVEASYALFGMCKTRKDGFKGLLEALRDSFQSGVVEILESLSTDTVINIDTCHEDAALPTSLTTCKFADHRRSVQSTSASIRPFLYDGNHQQRNSISIPLSSDLDVFSICNDKEPILHQPKRPGFMSRRQDYSRYVDYVPLENCRRSYTCCFGCTLFTFSCCNR